MSAGRGGETRRVMTPQRTVIALAALVAALAVVASLAGLLLPGEAARTAATTVRGADVLLYGEGLYRYDSQFTGAGYRGTDIVTLTCAVPLLLVSLVLYRRGSLRGGVLLTGVLAYVLYVYASLSLNAAFNSFFLVYVALFAASFYALVTLLRTVDLGALVAPVAERLPRLLPGVFFLVAGAATLVIWSGPLVAALLSGDAPARMDSYSTAVTTALDLAIITPACFVCGLLILRRRPLGYLVAFPLLGIIILLGPGFVTQTLWQLSAGVEFTAGEAIGPIAGFGAVALVALWVMVALLRRLSAVAATGAGARQTASPAASVAVP